VLYAGTNTGSSSCSQTHFTTGSQSVGQSVSQSVLSLIPSGSHDQILILVKTVAVLFVIGRHVIPVERAGLSCNTSHSLSVLSDTFICTFSIVCVFNIF
jgi:hypothetical protein